MFPTSTETTTSTINTTKMAKLCNSFGSSPCNSFFTDFMSSNSFDDTYNIFGLPSDLGIFKGESDLFDELNWPSTIQSDIAKIEKTESGIACDDTNKCLIDGEDFDLKPEIRNINCMWSDGQSLLSTSASSTMSDNVAAQTAVPLAAVNSFNTNLLNIKQEVAEPTVVVAKNSNNSSSSSSNKVQQQHTQQQQQQQQYNSRQNNLNVKKEIKMEPEDDYEQQLQQHSIPNNRTVQQNTQQQQQQQQQSQSMQHIPPGTSLLRKSNIAQQQLQQQHKKLQQQQKYANNIIQISKLNTNNNGFMRLREQCTAAAATTTTNATVNSNSNNNSNSTSLHIRPDTPHSLDDDCTEFKHNVDLRACVMGSNNISLSVDPTHYIQHVSQALQDTSKNEIDIGFGGGCNASLAEVLDVISKDYNSQQTKSNNNNKAHTKSATSSMSMLHLHNTDIDSDTESTSGNSSYDSGCSVMDVDMSYAVTSPISSQGSNSNSSHHQSYLHSDHSYTRCKDGMDDLGPSLETPSDSDEEIDVVTIGDKKLPTNPSDKDRRALQNKVAYKISNRMVKTVNGLRTIPPRRRGSVEYPYTPASSNSPVKSLANSRYPSQLLMTVLADGSSAPINIINDKTRKRVSGGGVSSVMASANNNATNTDYTLPPNKKYRGKKTKSIVSTHNNSNSSSSSMCASGTANGALRRHYSLDETADTIEKRNLHNDMERQRRIGLKNLFEALKMQIPSIKDKERAPKVNILREAAKLCDALVREDQQLCEQRALLKEQLKKRQELLARLMRQD